MARGKHAERAAVRRDTAATEASLESYRHAVARLTAENADLKERLQRVQVQSAKEIKVLRAMNEAGVSPELKAAHHEILQLRERLDQAHRDAKRVAEIRKREVDHMLTILIVEGWNRRDAFDLLAAGQTGNPGVVVTDNLKGGGDAQYALTVERARGARGAQRKHDDPDWQERYERVRRNHEKAVRNNGVKGD